MNKTPWEPGETPIVICRQASDYRRPGSVTGYQCKACGRELQVSPIGVHQISAGATPVCNQCGFALQASENAPIRALNPEARKQLAEWEREGKK